MKPGDHLSLENKLFDLLDKEEAARNTGQKVDRNAFKKNFTKILTSQKGCQRWRFFTLNDLKTFIKNFEDFVKFNENIEEVRIFHEKFNAFWICNFINWSY